jgi:hypothetical protein
LGNLCYQNLSAIPDLQNFKIKNESGPNNTIFVVTSVFKAFPSEGGLYVDLLYVAVHLSFIQMLLSEVKE